MSEAAQIAQMEQKIRGRGWSIRWAPTDPGYVVEARRTGEPPEGLAPWGTGPTQLVALQELQAALDPS